MKSNVLLSQVQAVLAKEKLQGKKKSCSVYDLGPAEPVTELIRPSEAWIVHCKYDSQVLITRGSSALPMIDIDDHELCSSTLESLLKGTELNVQFRVYKTAHGYRLLVESQTLKPDGGLFQGLAKAFDCDDSYLQLCRMQNCYRARLSLKPDSAEGVRVCRYLGTIGSAGIDENLAPMIHLHDERTGALLESGELG